MKKPAKPRKPKMLVVDDFFISCDRGFVELGIHTSSGVATVTFKGLKLRAIAKRLIEFADYLESKGKT